MCYVFVKDKDALFPCRCNELRCDFPFFVEDRGLGGKEKRYLGNRGVRVHR